MHFLDVRGDAAGDRENVVSSTARKSFLAGESDRHGALAVRHRQSANNVLRRTAGTESEHNVARRRQCLDLPFEQRTVTKVVRDARDGSDVTAECYCSVGTTRFLEPSDQLAGHMAGLCRRAAIPKAEDLVTAEYCGNERVSGRGGHVREDRCACLHRADVFREMGGDRVAALCRHVFSRMQSPPATTVGRGVPEARPMYRP